MKRATSGGGTALAGLPASFVRGAIASGIVAALRDKREGQALLQSALVGGAALSTAVAVENLLFDGNAGLGKEADVGKKRKGGKKNKRGALDVAVLEDLLRQAQPTGLAALTPGQQFLAGALLGVAVTYVIGDEALRGKLLRAGMRLYTDLAGGFAEIKEQMADIEAELAAEQRSL
jgi:hypothetical protein